MKPPQKRNRAVATRYDKLAVTARQRLCQVPGGRSSQSKVRSAASAPKEA